MIEAIVRMSASLRQADPLQVDPLQVDTLQVDTLQVDVFSLNGHPTHGDEALAEDLQSRLRERGIAVMLRAYRGRDPLATVREVGRCDAFISARLHGAIVAYMCGVPFALVEYHPKCRDFADDVGLPRVLRITSERHGVETLTAAVAAMLNDGGTPPRVSPDIYAREAEKIFQYAPWSIRSMVEAGAAP
jgi:polysaccharide pyruvyl transferase WcaK-like protein